MKLAGASEHDLAKALGVSYQAIKKVLLGTTKMLKADHNLLAAKYLRVDSEWLATGEGSARGERVWPLSQELLRAILAAEAVDRETVENTARSVLKLQWSQPLAGSLTTLNRCAQGVPMPRPTCNGSPRPMPSARTAKK